MLAADTLEALGMPRGEYVIKVNNRKVLDGVLEAIGLGGEAERSQAAQPYCAQSTSTIGLEIDGVRSSARPRTQGRKRRLHERSRTWHSMQSISY